MKCIKSQTSVFIDRSNPCTVRVSHTKSEYGWDYCISLFPSPYDYNASFQFFFTEVDFIRFVNELNSEYSRIRKELGYE